jgi:hypothetical protein
LHAERSILDLYELRRVRGQIPGNDKIRGIRKKNLSFPTGSVFEVYIVI